MTDVGERVIAALREPADADRAALIARLHMRDDAAWLADPHGPRGRHWGRSHGSGSWTSSDARWAGERRIVTDEPRDVERRDAWAVVDLEAAVSVVTTTVGAIFGPAGAIVGALVGPYAKHAAARLLDLRARVEEAGLDTETIVDRLDENEELAQLIVEAVRTTVESDLAAKRALLARAAIRALEDDAVVDLDQRIVRAASEVDTVDVRVLAIIAEPVERPEPPPSERNVEDAVYPDELESRWAGAAEGATAATSSLIAAGLIENAGAGGYGGATFWKTTPLGDVFLRRLRSEGLEDELRARDRS